MHAQVASNAKLFSGASTAFGGEPNSHVSLVDAAMPGMLPVINEECVAQAVRTGLGLKAEINLRSVFDRKNYFYPDLPQGYQICQYKQPIVGEGEVEIDVDGETMQRRHRAAASGAGRRQVDPRPAPDYSFVDLNRSGVALMEIVSKPDMRSAKEAQAYVTKLRTILRYLGTCDGNMEKGNLRADVNVSVRKPGDELGTRCEIKNVNSIRFIGQAIESRRAARSPSSRTAATIEQETRLFDPGKGETRSMRSKEEAHDYRYFPDPDLLPLELTHGLCRRAGEGLPELPDAKKARFMRDFGLSDYDAGVLVAERETADYFEAVAQGARRQARGELGDQRAVRAAEQGRAGIERVARVGRAARRDRRPDRHGHHLRQDRQGRVRDRVDRGRRSGGDRRGARDEAGHRHRRHREGGRRDHRRQPRQGRAGEGQAAMLGWFVGQVMKATGGKANPQAVNELLKQKLGV